MSGKRGGKPRIVPAAYLVALTVRYATEYAEDQGWTREGSGNDCLWRRPDGRVVKAVHAVEHLRDKPRGTRVYLGYRWDDRGDVRLLREFLDTGKIVRAEAEQCIST